MSNSHTSLYALPTRTMSGQLYINDVLQPHVCMFRGAAGDKFVFMDGNATCHQTVVVQKYLQIEDIQCFVWQAHSPDLNTNVWQAHSPDLNTNENVWNALGEETCSLTMPSNK
ncbi:hypothetical protein X975_03881, partial [Stegodyphus mimosarum]